MKKLTNYLVFFKLLIVILTVSMSRNSLYSQACVSCDGTTTSGLFPSAIGRYTKATANYSFAGGIYSEAKGSASFAFGNRAFAVGGSSAVIGQFARATASTAMVFGAGFDIDNPLINNETHSLMIGFGSTKPTLFVGLSNGASYTGKVGIGNVTDPQAKLHIRADDGMIAEDATLMLEATGSGKSNKILMHGSQGYIGTTSERYSLNFFTGEGNNRMIIDGESGNVGIGTGSPKQRMHVNGNFLVEGSGSTILFTHEVNDPYWGKWGIEYWNDGLNFWQPYGWNYDKKDERAENFRLFLKDDGNVGIGTGDP